MTEICHSSATQAPRSEYASAQRAGITEAGAPTQKGKKCIDQVCPQLKNTSKDWKWKGLRDIPGATPPQFHGIHVLGGVFFGRHTIFFSEPSSPLVHGVAVAVGVRARGRLAVLQVVQPGSK